MTTQDKIALALLALQALLPHLVALLPPQYRAALGPIGQALNVLAGNYANARNVTDQQDQITPKP